MGGVAKAVGGVASKGKGGDNPGASENTIKNAMIYPELRDPAWRAITDAGRLYQQGYSVPKMNQREWQGIQGIEDWAGQYGGQLNDVMGNVSNIAQGNRAGDAPGTEFLQRMFSGKAGQAPGDDFFRSMLQPQGDSSSQNFFEGVYDQGGAPKEGWGALQRAVDLADDGSGGLSLLRDTAKGKMVGQNPYLDSVIGAMNRGTTDAYGNAIAGMEGGMSRAGGMGGSMESLLRGKQNEGLATSLAENEAKIRYGDYGQERGYQQQAQMALPGALATETGAMTAAGSAMNQAAMGRLQAQMGAAQQAQQGDWQQLQARMQAAQQAGQGYRSDLDRQMQAANLAGQGYRNDIGQQLAAAGQMPGLGTSGFLPGQQLMSAGEYTRNNLQNQNNAGWTGLQQYLDNLKGVTGLFSNQGAIKQAPDAGAQMVGNATQLGSMAAMGYMMSDRRLKTDIEEVGHGLYRWRYLWGGPLYEGPMAQDVLEVAPELVGTDGLGYLTIPASLIREVL
jgi:hypothetical protein